MGDEEIKVPEPPRETTGWLQVNCANARLGNERFKKRSFVKLNPRRQMWFEKAPKGTFTLHKTLDPKLKERLKADGLLVE